MEGLNIKSFAVQLDNSSRTYFAGQYMTGKIILNSENEINSRGIALRFSGIASLSWNESVEEGTGDNLRSVTKQYANKEIYMDEELYAFGRVGEAQDLIIKPGYHEYPFTYQLPPNVPSTYQYNLEQIHADITYRVEAIIKRSARKTDYKTNMDFIVKAVMNVNRYSQATQPVVVFKEKHLCCFCCKNGPITMNITMTKTGYFPGEIMKFLVDISNFSSKRIVNIDATIEQETHFLSTIRDKEKVLVEAITKVPPGPPIEPNKKGYWEGELVIPDVLPTNLGGCHIIVRTYLLKISANIALSRGIKAAIPIVIGSAPKKILSNADISNELKGGGNSPSFRLKADSGNGKF